MLGQQGTRDILHYYGIWFVVHAVLLTFYRYDVCLLQGIDDPMALITTKKIFPRSKTFISYEIRFLLRHMHAYFLCFPFPR